MANEPASGDNGHVFYNVLPRERASGPLANAAPGAMANEPAAAPVSAGGPTVTSFSTNFINRFRGLLTRRNLIIGGAVIVILAIGGFFLYRWATKPAEPLPLTNEPPIEQPAEPQQPEGVTTPTDWQKRYFGEEICQNVTVCGDASDPDRDGLTNIEEFTATTDPNNSDSNGGGLADGDKVHVFGGDPLKIKTKEGPYTDADYAKYGYDLATDQPYTPEKLAEIKAKIKEFGLHQPTITTLGEEALALYEFTNFDPANSSDPLQGFDLSANAKLDRDTQRSNTIKKVGIALIKYYGIRKSYPSTTEFTEMANTVRPYITVATNFADPVNKDKYVYGYIPSANGQDFTLTYFSETQNLLIKYNAQAAQLEANKEAAAAYDDQRKRDLDNLRVALLLYSGHHVDSHSTQAYVFPPADRYKAELVSGDYISEIPKDPRTGQDYAYEVSEKFDNFTLRTILDNPAVGTTGYLCNPEECVNY